MASALSSYEKKWLRADIVAGLVTGAVVIPKAMAYATVAGLPPQVGLYTALVPMLAYAVLGTSRPLSVSTTTTLAILTGTKFGEMLPDADPAALEGTLVALTLLVGSFLVLGSFLRLGFVANFISEPVLVGFKAGIGLVIVADQVPKLLGIHVPKAGFLQNLLAIAERIPEASLPTLAVGVATIVVLVVFKRLAPKLPAPLIAVAAGIAAVPLLDLAAHGVESIGTIPRGLPAVVLPDYSQIDVLWPAALGIALMSFTETIAAGRAFARSDEPPVRSNRELFATGVANACGAIVGAMPAGGGTSQTAVNRMAGARSQIASVVTAGATLSTMLLLARPMGMMPQATLAAIVIVYSIGLIQPGEFRAISSIRRTEFVWALIALGGVVLVGTLNGIVVAIVVSLFALAHQTANPPVYVLGRKPGTNVFRPLSKEHPEDETYPGLLIVRLQGRIFFANAERIGDKMRLLIEEAKPKVVAIHLRSVFDLEYTALKMLTEAEQRQRERGVRLWLVGMNPEVLEMVQRSPLGRALGREGMHFNLEIAVAKYLESVNAGIAKPGVGAKPP
jgi:high affinity sulfate transporter 1